MDEQKKPERSDSDRVKDLLTEALSGTSMKSQKTLIKEALKIVEQMH